MELRRTRPRPSRRPHRKPLLLDALRQEEKPVFHAIEAQHTARRLGFRGPIRHLLAQLVEEGALVKLKFGTYGFGHRVLGVASPHPFAVGVALVKGAAIGALSALHYRGAVAQAPEALWLVTPRKVRSRHLDAGNLHVEVLGVKPRFFFGADVVELDAFSHAPIFTPERALLDLFAHPGRFGGFHATFDVLEEALQHLVVSELVESTIRYSVSSVAKRIGWALEGLGVPAKETAPLIPLCVPQPLPLDSKRQAVGVQNPRWHVIENMDAARVGGSPKRRRRLS
jgi:predicted transcriptional regulator of viral defense system